MNNKSPRPIIQKLLFVCLLLPLFLNCFLALLFLPLLRRRQTRESHKQRERAFLRLDSSRPERERGERIFFDFPLLSYLCFGIMSDDGGPGNSPSTHYCTVQREGEATGQRVENTAAYGQFERGNGHLVATKKNSLNLQGFLFQTPVHSKPAARRVCERAKNPAHISKPPLIFVCVVKFVFWLLHTVPIQAPNRALPPCSTPPPPQEQQKRPRRRQSGGGGEIAISRSQKISPAYFSAPHQG